MLHVTDVLPKGSFVYDPIYAERGKLVHAACHLLETDGLDWATVPLEWRGYVEAWQRFTVQSKAEIRRSEFPVESKEHEYIGRVDNLIKIKRLYILDKKTGPPAPTVGLQLAGYSGAYREMFGDPMPLRAVVQLSADGSYKFTAEDTPGQKYFAPTDFRVFLAFLTGKKWEMQHGLWSPQNREEE